MKTLTFVLFALSFSAVAQEKIMLYPAGQKVTKENFDKDKEPPLLIRFAPVGQPNGMAIMVCPGGGYGHLAMGYEGTDVAQFFSNKGFHAFVLQYRLNNQAQEGHRFPDQFNDVTRGIRMIRSRASEWAINPDRIGILGFSAGGHLASMATTIHLDGDERAKDELDRVSSRPSFSALIYPVIDMNGTYAHQGSRTNLLGKDPRPGLADSLSTQNRVNAQTPPTFIVFSTDDDVVPVENGIMFYHSLKNFNVPATIHIFDHGGHGYGMGRTDKVLTTWPELCVAWINSIK